MGLGLVALVFLAPPDVLPGSARADLGQQFLAWRAFAADGLRHGHLPLWNPYTYAGEPFLGGFQSAVFYPPNLLFLVLPLCRAVDLTLVLHLLLLGWGMFRWASDRGLHPWAAALCGVVLPLSGPVFPQIYAGHLANLCSLAWTPWIFAGLESAYRGGCRARRGWLIASGAFALQLLAGQAQYAFFTAVAVGLHALAFAPASPAGLRRTVPAAAAAVAAVAALTAVQILPGLAAASEGLRHTRLEADFAGQFSFPPENLLTVIAPGFFGDSARHAYWGRCYPWDMSLFLGASGLVLIALALADPATRRMGRRDLGIAAFLLLLALGRHTPLFRPLYEFVPGFDRFRGWSKFSFPAGAFLVLAIGAGADGLMRRPPPGAAVPLGALVAGFVLGGVGLAWWNRPSEVASFRSWVLSRGESYLPASDWADPGSVRLAGLQSGRALAVSGGCFLLAGASLLLARRRPGFRWLALGLLPAELAAFIPGQFGLFREADAVSPEVSAFVQAHPGDYRVQNLVEPDNGYLHGTPDIWGNDPALLGRYAEFMAYSQGGDPGHATQNVAFRSPSPLYRLLRLRYVISRSPAGLRFFEVPDPLPRVQLVTEFRTVPRRDDIFSELSRPDFDPGRTVLLEEDPSPRPQPGTGTARILADSPDAFTVEAETTGPAILLITDAYSRDWRARALAWSSQAQYRILPADYVLRATPLAAGRHRIRFEYRPAHLGLGAAISALAWMGWLGLMVAAGRKRPLP